MLRARTRTIRDVSKCAQQRQQHLPLSFLLCFLELAVDDATIVHGRVSNKGGASFVFALLRHFAVIVVPEHIRFVCHVFAASC